ncbi:uncharacterized protein LOC121598758 [Anopheles merus]|uniref:uncharacterized protein LOC121598758 n=1 Tax=Anopheles merus TaxID=30066 RepID=UPI001BE492FC|nr:uncharacterized protein LOC121598758 [Anopheles merus]
MDEILNILQEEDVRIYEVFRKEEITDLDTFLSLDNNDFTRLQLTTKMIKIIQKASTNGKKVMLAKSLIKTYPILASNVSDVPYAAWFHKGGRGAGRHAGSIHYRMETLAKRSCSRVFYRSRHDEATPSSSKIITNDECGENIDDLVYELETIVPLENSMENIKYLWKQTLAYRHEKRDRGIFSQFMTDCSAASAFGGELISLEFELMNPTAAKFEDMWNVIQQKILEKFRIDYRYIKNDLIQSLCLVREKNTIRGAKRTREEDYKENDARTLNPLHGIIDWIDN